MDSPGETLKRFVFLSALVFMGVFLVASVAYARTISCTGSGLCAGTPKHDLMRGGAGDDTVVGKGGDDRLTGDNDQDMLKGKDGSDTLNAGNDDDKAKGGGGRDTVMGGPGDDILRGASHGGINDGVRDVIDCGEGTDTVYYVPGQDSISDCEIVNTSDQ